LERQHKASFFEPQASENQGLVDLPKNLQFSNGLKNKDIQGSN
jgi:hypothetical protein